MAAVHKILKDSYEDSFALIAVHSAMEDYALVYAINLCLKSKLKRSTVDLDMPLNLSFPIFEWKDTVNESYWTLLKNVSTKKQNVNAEGLFNDETSHTKYHLLPEYKEVDYFLKIENDGLDIDDGILKTILAIPKVITAYAMKVSNLKSKNNLIF